MQVSRIETNFRAKPYLPNFLETKSIHYLFTKVVYCSMSPMTLAREILLFGSLDPENPLSLIHANRLVWTKIFKQVDDWYDEHIDTTSRGFHMVTTPIWSLRRKQLKFPEAHGIQVNMMPILMFDEASIPEFCRPYIGLIRACPVTKFDCHGSDLSPVFRIDRIAYLTIDESIVPVGRSQRRPGLHVERPGAIEGGGRLCQPGSPEFRVLQWGCGAWGFDGPIDGIYMASNRDGACAVYDELVVRPEEVSDKHGGIEHMRPHLGPGRVLNAGELCWITDRTPHESLPLKGKGNDRFVHRSFFRLVVGRISVWYSKHNTPNPLGILPDCPIVDDDKFA